MLKQKTIKKVMKNVQKKSKKIGAEKSSPFGDVFSARAENEKSSLFKQTVVGIDPGQNGGFAILYEGGFEFLPMPLVSKKTKEVDFFKVLSILEGLPPNSAVFLERAYGGQMGATSAFNYGRGFAALRIALAVSEQAVALIEPSKWCKEMHQGISSDLKPKVKSLEAMRREFPKELKAMPANRNGKVHEGILDAFLIAAYGQRVLASQEANLGHSGASQDEPLDFY